MSLLRSLRHLFAPPWIVRRALPKSALAKIEAAIRDSERRHRGEIRFAVEGSLDFLAVVRGLMPRPRALELFSSLRVWDTEENTGVLIYLQLVDRDIEIVADRGIARLIPQERWEGICGHMEGLSARDASGRRLGGIREVSELLSTHFPAAPGTRRVARPSGRTLTKGTLIASARGCATPVRRRARPGTCPACEVY